MNTVASRPERVSGDAPPLRVLALTPDQILGPFYPLMGKPTRGGDLVQLPGRKSRAQGQIIHVTGRVCNREGALVRRGRLVIWQANSVGRYRHPTT
jgi:protocatechuate 3,4-dioxygenase beta subunit